MKIHGVFRLLIPPFAWFDSQETAVLRYRSIDFARTKRTYYGS